VATTGQVQQTLDVAGTSQVRVAAWQILNALERMHDPHTSVFMTEVKNGPTWDASELLRMDAIAMAKSWKRPNVTAFEVKISRSDFLRDNKWHLYADYCNYLYMVCPKGMIQANELPDIAGLMYYDPEIEKIVVKRRAPFRQVEIPAAMFQYMVMSKLDRERCPFFSDRREYLQAWVADKADRDMLASKVSSKMAKTIHEQDELIDELTAIKNDHEELVKHVGELEEVLKKHGIIREFETLTGTYQLTRRWTWQDVVAKVDKALSVNGAPPQVVDIARRLFEEAQKLNALFETEEAAS
jgi:hypothetical protein